MFKKIMVPVDLEHLEKMERTRQLAVELARQYGAAVCYATVAGRVPNRAASSPEVLAEKLDSFASEEGQRHGIQTEAIVKPSTDVIIELDRKLLEACSECGADLVVMASHIPGVADRLHLISSNAADFVRKSKVSVLVVR